MTNLFLSTLGAFFFLTSASAAQAAATPAAMPATPVAQASVAVPASPATVKPGGSLPDANAIRVLLVPEL